MLGLFCLFIGHGVALCRGRGAFDSKIDGTCQHQSNCQGADDGHDLHPGLGLLGFFYGFLLGFFYGFLHRFLQGGFRNFLSGFFCRFFSFEHFCFLADNVFRHFHCIFRIFLAADRTEGNFLRKLCITEFTIHNDPHFKIKMPVQFSTGFGKLQGFPS